MLRYGVDRELRDYRYLRWSHTRNSSGTAGTFLKAYEETGGRKIYYKLSNFDYENGVVGHECVNEIICNRLFSILGIDHLSYRLFHARIEIDGREYETYLCASDDFKRPGESKIALDDYYDLNRKSGESRMDFCRRMGWEDDINRMTAADFLIINRDRHGANIEVLKSGEDCRLAPLFDHGLSLLFSVRDEKAAEMFDPMKDYPVQSFAGSHSLYENLQHIPEDRLPLFRRLDERDCAFLLQDLEGILPDIYLKKIWEVIWGRWCYYEDLRSHR